MAVTVRSMKGGALGRGCPLFARKFPADTAHKVLEASFGMLVSEARVAPQVRHAEICYSLFCVALMPVRLPHWLRCFQLEKHILHGEDLRGRPSPAFVQ